MNFKDIMAKAMQPKAGAPAGVTIKALDEEGEVEILLYDQIGYWGVEAAEFVASIKDVKATVIHLRIDSPGGDVFAARAMKTALEQHPAKVVTHVDGLAASAASYLMLAGDEIEIAKGAFVMIHNAWTITLGDTREHMGSADLLAKIDQSIQHDYATKSGKDIAEFQPLMDAETWLEADEALELGLVDRVYEKSGGAENRYDLTIFDNAPAALKSPAEDKDAVARVAAHVHKLEYYERIAP